MADGPGRAGASEGEGLALCASSALADRGRAQVWDVLLRGERTTAFALRLGPRVVAYVNRCLHMDAEMDWNPGDFLDREGTSIVCSLHGASYDAGSGRCVGGPCGRGVLEPVSVKEIDGLVRWYPSTDIQPPSASKARP